MHVINMINLPLPELNETINKYTATLQKTRELSRELKEEQERVETLESEQRAIKSRNQEMQTEVSRWQAKHTIATILNRVQRYYCRIKATSEKRMLCSSTKTAFSVLHGLRNDYTTSLLRQLQHNGLVCH